MSHEQRLIKLRLSWFQHVREISGNVAQTCRYYGITRPTYYRWYNRYLKDGEAGLKDRSKRPHVSPRSTKKEIREKIIYLRQHYYFGPSKIQMYLKRYHDIKIGIHCIWHILKLVQMNRLPSNQRYRRYKERFIRYEKPLPGHQIQIDVKFLEKIPNVSDKRYYQFTAIDDCTRVRIMQIFERNNQKNAVKFVDYVLSKLPFQVCSIQTDNGAEFQSQFHWHLTDKGIKHVYIRPATPRLNGKVERSHRIDDEEFYQMLKGVVINNTELFNEKLQEWENFYNYQRPHGALNGKSPFEKLQEKLAPVCNT